MKTSSWSGILFLELQQLDARLKTIMLKKRYITIKATCLKFLKKQAIYFSAI